MLFTSTKLTSATSNRSYRFRPTVTALEERSLMSAGVLDTGFNGDGKTQVFYDIGGQNSDQANAVAVQADGKIVVVGRVQGPNGDNDFAITRLNPDGSRDNNFGNSGRVRIPFDIAGGKNDEAHAVAIQADGKIVVAGKAERANGDYDMAVLRLNSDGTLDTGFSPGGVEGDGKALIFFDLGGANFDAAYGIALKPGKIILAGVAQTAALGFDMAVAQLEDNGMLDTNFSPGGAGVDGGDGRTVVDFGSAERANAVAVQGNKIILVGNTGNSDMAVARLTDVGTLDNTFGPNNNGKTTIAFDLGGNNVDTADAVVIQPDGKIVIAGSVERISAGDVDFGLARLTENGALDTATFGGGTGKAIVAFDLGGGKADRATGIALQPDGKIIVVGTVEQANGNTDIGVARLTGAGGLDVTYGNTGKTVVAFDLGQQNKDTATGVALTSGNRAVVVGTVQRSSMGDTDFGIVQLLGDPPAAPTVATPSTAVTVDQATFNIQGTAEAGSLVRVYRDVNNNNQIDAGDTVVGQQQLGAAETAYSILVPLVQNTANHFVVTATKFNSESTPTDVPTITDVFTPPVQSQTPTATVEGIAARVIRRRQKSFIEVRGAQSGLLRRVYGPYNKAQIALQDVNQDGVLDLVMRTNKNGKKRMTVCSGVDLSVLRSSGK